MGARADPRSGDIKVVVDDFVEPNGIAFSPDEKKLYVIDTGFTDGPDKPSHIRVFDADVESGKVFNSKVFAEMPKPSITDGIRADTAGRIWCSVGWGDPSKNGVCTYTPENELLGKIHIPETVASLCFGCQQRNRLCICGSTSLYPGFLKRERCIGSENLRKVLCENSFFRIQDGPDADRV
jgi:gluconolactonase